MNFDEVKFPYLGFSVNVDPVAFSIGSFDIYWYGIIIGLAILLCGFLAVKQAKSQRFSEDLVYDILLSGLPGALIGARLYYVAFEWDYYSQDIRRIFNIHSGGLAVYGGVIGAVIAVYIMCRIKKLPFVTVLDYAIVYIPLGQAIGRWGNFFNQEAFGTTTNLPWGMTSQRIYNYIAENCTNLDPSMPVHPTFLYESLFNFFLFGFLLYVRNYSEHKFETTSAYMFCYGFIRFLIEGLRTDALYIGSTGIRASQLLSLVIIIIGLVLTLVSHWKEMRRTALPASAFAYLRNDSNKDKQKKEENTDGNKEA
ncbi:MAG: prolipoprotein diacylglyceryl transferase [Clostridiales bacterium]|nr:prolipoprotein diacylglyceryl transferase [Clostridiales bacterium]